MAKEESLKKLSEFANSINQIEGFNPFDATSEVANADGNGVDRFLPLIYKKMWARKVYPYHRCEAEIKSVKNGVVTAAARFYPTNELEKAHIGEGFTFLKVIPEYGEDEKQAELRTCLLALGSAKSRAYTDAGFGLQFFTDDCLDNTQAEMLKQMDSAITTSNEEMDSPITIAQHIDEEKKSGRKTQAEMLAEENAYMQSLSNELPDVVAMFATATVGSPQYATAMAKKEALKKDWEDTLSSIKTRLSKKSVQQALSSNPISLVSETFAEAWAKAEDYVSSSEETIIETADEFSSEEELNSEVSFEIPVELESPIGIGGTYEKEEQMTLFDEMSLADAKAFVLKSESPSFDGKSIGSIYETNKFSLLPIFNKTSDKNQREALIKVISEDSELNATAIRKGIALIA